MFSTVVSQIEAFTKSKMVSRKPEVVTTSSPINIFETFQILCMFSTLASSTGLFTTSRNGFMKTGNSYNFIPYQHFRKISNTIRVFDYFQSSGSMHNLQKWFPLCMFSTIVSQMEAFTTSKNGFQKT